MIAGKDWLRKLIGGAPAAAALPPTPEGLSDDQWRRKRASIDRLRAEGVPVIEHLPAIESEAEAALPGVPEVAARLTALVLVAAKGEGVDAARVDELVDEFAAHGDLTPREAAFIADRAPAEHDRVQFIWRYEAAWVLFWALGWVDGPLGMPRDICDVARLAATVRDTPDLGVHGLRPAAEILDETDLIYRCHWATRDASLKGLDAPAGLEGGVTMERHHALNWLVGPRDVPWDEVDCST